jgi:NAD(P)-dependent dehydrogenase (short-subunit alcohol dehydrogenase family)
MEQFNGRVAVITGAGSGIGRALVQHAAGLGMQVVACDIEEPPLHETASLATADGGVVTTVRADVSVAADVQHLADTAFDVYGHVDLLCNNAGVFRGGFMWSTTPADWEWVMGVNVQGILHAVRSFVPRMVAQGTEGHIVNTASMAGIISGAFTSPYTTSKFAALALSECLAHDLRATQSAIGVSVLVPSLIRTGIGTSERNRPERVVDRLGDDPPEAQFVAQALVDSTAAGMEPSEVAQIVFDAIRTGQFYIPTKGSYHQQIRARYDDQEALRLPATPPID